MANNRELSQFGSFVEVDNSTIGITTSVGINKTNPQYTLDVSGDINFTGTFYQSGNQFIASRWSAAGSDIYRLSKVGINVEAPEQALHVSGTVLATQLSTGASGTGINVTTNSITGPATITIDPAAVGDDTGTVEIKGNLTVQGTTTTVNSTTVTLNQLSLGDNEKIFLGDGNDLEIYSDGTNAVISEVSGEGSFFIRGANILFQNSAGTEGYAQFNANGAVELYYDNAKKLETVTTGISVTGNVSASTLTSSVAVGTAPLTVTSTTKVSNLNVDLLDDQEGSYYLNYANFSNTPTIGNGTLTLAVSGVGLSGSQTFTANQTTNSTFTVTSNATSNDTASTIVSRDASGNFSAGTITASLSGNASTASTLQTSRKINGIDFDGSVDITITANTPTNITFNNAGSGGASGSTFNGGSALTVSYNTVGAPSTTGANASGTWGISVTGNAATATTLQTSRTISLTGDVTGSVNFNGSQNVSISTTIGANSVALGTDTTGNYIATIAGTANEIEVTGSGSESAAVTISLPSTITIDGVNLTTTGALSTTTTTVATTSATTIESFSATTHRSARVQVQITQGTNYQTSDILLIHDGTTVDIIEYASVATNGYLGDFTATISGGNCLLRINMVSATSATVKTITQKITV
jgi:hypothetical protein